MNIPIAEDIICSCTFAELMERYFGTSGIVTSQITLPRGILIRSIVRNIRQNSDRVIQLNNRYPILSLSSPSSFYSRKASREQKKLLPLLSPQCRRAIDALELILLPAR